MRRAEAAGETESLARLKAEQAALIKKLAAPVPGTPPKK
jgi:hypothetical protein